MTSKWRCPQPCQHLRERSVWLEFGDFVRQYSSRAPCLEGAQHHIIGTPVVNDIEDPASDDTLSIVGGSLVGEEASVFNEDFESVGGDVAPSEIESDPTPLQKSSMKKKGLKKVRKEKKTS